MGDKLLDLRTGTRKNCRRIAASPSELRTCRISAADVKELGRRPGSASRSRNGAVDSPMNAPMYAAKRSSSGRSRHDVRLCLRPRSIEEREQPVMEHVQKPAERRVAGIAQPLARVLGEMKRQRTIRTEQTKQPDLQARRAAVGPGVERRERRRRKREIGILSEPNALVDGTQRATPARFLRVQALQPAQRLIEVALIRRRREFGEENLQRRSRAPFRHPSVDFAPAVRSQDGFGERVDRHVTREEAMQNRGEQERARTLERHLVNAEGHLESASKHQRPRPAQPPNHRPDVHRLHGVDLLLRSCAGGRHVQLETVAQAPPRPARSSN